EPGTPPSRATEASGGGPVIRAWEWMTSSLMGTAYHRGLFRRLQDVAEAAGIPHQLDVARTFTDACGTSGSGHGVPTRGALLAPRRAHPPRAGAQLAHRGGA